MDQLVKNLYSSIRREDANVNNCSEYPPQYNPRQGEEFDFIIIGAGSAGAVLANRLTEIEGWNVLLLEAGGDPPKDAQVPALAGSLQRTDIDWQYGTYHEEDNCLSMRNRSCLWPRGKVLGGSSVINYMIYVRGNAKDFDSWAAEGNTGWSYEEVLPYFKKSEDMRAPRVLNTRDAQRYHATGGFLSLEALTNSGNPLMRAFQKGFDELGFPFNPDYNGQTQFGFSQAIDTLRDHRRCGTDKAFISSAKTRTNLKLSRCSLATKVLIDNNTSTAIGVEFINFNGDTVQVLAKKEVIVSAGAINSPQLLMLSGIGPKQHLIELGIPVKKHLPVGEELQDHPLLTNLLLTINYILPSVPSTKSTFDFLFKGNSPLSFINGFEFTAFFNVQPRASLPDAQLLQAYFDKNDATGITSFLNFSLGYNDEITNQVLEINKDQFTVQLVLPLLTPFSRGKILLRKSDPEIHPRIISGYLTDRRDIEGLMQMFQFIYRFANTTSLKNINATVHELRVSACETYPFKSEKYRECALRHLVTTSYHPCCTCGMGRVVDSRLRVKGVSRLRVVDASAMPNITRGNINAPVIMLAEKASDLIKETWS